MLQDDGRSYDVRAWVGRDAIARARTPGPAGPGFELDVIQRIAARTPATYLGGELYLTRDTRPYHPGTDSDRLTYCWRIWNQDGKCQAFRMTRAE
jgi:hypothetical protein